MLEFLDAVPGGDRRRGGDVAGRRRRCCGPAAGRLPHRDRLRPRRRRRRTPRPCGGSTAVKGRPADHPLIVHLASAGAVPRWAAAVPPAAAALAEACWPGPLTLLLPRRADVDATVTGGRDTVGLRVPAHPLALELLRGLRRRHRRAVGQPLRPGQPDDGRPRPGRPRRRRRPGPRRRPVHDRRRVDDRRRARSTLRPSCARAASRVEALEAIVGGPVRTDDGGPSRAPGMLASHYAPLRPRRGGRGPRRPLAGGSEELRARGERAELLDPGPDPGHYARHLYDVAAGRRRRRRRRSSSSSRPRRSDWAGPSGTASARPPPPLTDRACRHAGRTATSWRRGPGRGR